jgi:prepilin signal peptidase PulO-like enzyme (type II secretory pathway)
MERLLIALAWAALGAALGVVIRVGSVYLARKEDLEPGAARWQVFGPPIANAVLFGVFAYVVGLQPLLLIRSLWVAVLVQVIFFDLEHRLILDRVMFPSMLLAILLAQFTPHMNWLISLVTGLAAGILFLLIALAGAAIFRAEALGFGDVKLAAFMGLILGIAPASPPIIQALFYGVLLAGVSGILMILFRIKALRDTFAYGPYLAAGALITLLRLGAQ